MEGTYSSDVAPLIGNLIVFLIFAAVPWFVARWTTHRGLRFLSAVPGVLIATGVCSIFAVDSGFSVVPRAADMTHNYGWALMMLAGNAVVYLVVWSVIFALIVRHGASKRSASI